MSIRYSFRPLLVCAVALYLLVLSGCSGYGPKVKSENIEVYYKDGATKEEAERLGTFLNEQWNHPGDTRSVQLVKAGDGYQFRMVVKKEFQNDQAILTELEFAGARISRDVFDGAAVEVHACDEKFNTLHTFPPRADIRYGLVKGNVELFYPEDIEKEDAQRLLDHLVVRLGDVERVVSYKLAKRGDVYEVHGVINPDMIDDPGVLAEMRVERILVSSQVFGGAPVELHLCDELFKPLKVLKPEAAPKPKNGLQK